MPNPPPVNPNINEIADRAKYEFAIGAQVIAKLQLQNAELYGVMYRLDPDEYEELQRLCVNAWAALYRGAAHKIRHNDVDGDMWGGEVDDTYSDGRPVRTPEEVAEVRCVSHYDVLRGGVVAARSHAASITGLLSDDVDPRAGHHQTVP